MTSLGAENVRYESPTGEITTVGFRRAAGVEAVRIPPKVQQAPPAHDSPAEAFGRHFIRCFFCRIGDRYTEDHFCEAGRDLLVAVLDEYAERAFA